MRCAVDVVTEDISHHLGKTCRSLNQTLPWTVPAASVVQPHPILGMVHFRRASSHPTLRHSSAQRAPSRLSGRQRSASPHHQRDRCSRSLLRFHSPGAGLAVPTNAGGKNRGLRLHFASSLPTPQLVNGLAGSTSFGQQGGGLKAYYDPARFVKTI